MNFEEKVKLIDWARVHLETFKQEFNEYLAFGHSLNGAYNYFTIEDVEKHKKLDSTKKEVENWTSEPGTVKDKSPAPLKTSKPALEKLNVVS